MLDLLIKNGHVIDPANRTDQVGNIAIYNGRITRYEEGEPARHVVDAAGRYVFPGLIDAHAHMFQEGTEIGIYPDVAYLPTGVTSAIDFSAGVANYPIFRSAVIARSRVTIKSFLQVNNAINGLKQKTPAVPANMNKHARKTIPTSSVRCIMATKEWKNTVNVPMLPNH